MIKAVFYLVLVFPIGLFGDIGVLKSIIDGDTIKFNNATCRIAYIDTPESHKNAKAKRDAQSCHGVTVETIMEMGKESTRHAALLLQIGKSYHYDVINTDRYKRSICVVELGETLFNEQMIADGYAVVYERYVPDRLKRRYRLLEQEAKRAHKGLWGKYKKICSGY